MRIYINNIKKRKLAIIQARTLSVFLITFFTVRVVYFKMVFNIFIN
jgi:hypothetical protein